MPEQCHASFNIHTYLYVYCVRIVAWYWWYKGVYTFILHLWIWVGIYFNLNQDCCQDVLKLPLQIWFFNYTALCQLSCLTIKETKRMVKNYWCVATKIHSIRMNIFCSEPIGFFSGTKDFLRNWQNETWEIAICTNGVVLWWCGFHPIVFKYAS